MKQAPGSMITFRRPDGKDVQGYLAKPEKLEGAPAIVVIQEWWGLNDQIRGVADRFAQSGYLALVPDLFRGKIHRGGGRGESPVERPRLRRRRQPGHSRRRTVSENAVGAGRCDRLSAWAARSRCWRYAISRSVSAGVVWYGFPPLEYIDASKIKAPVLGHWATQDAFFPAETVDALESKLTEAKVDVEFHRYLAHHAFANETAVGPGRIARTQFDPVWSQLAWDRTLTFFGRTLWPQGQAAASITM